MSKSISLQKLSARKLFANRVQLEIELEGLHVLEILKKYWKEDEIMAYIADSHFYPRRYRDISNGAIYSYMQSYHYHKY